MNPIKNKTKVSKMNYSTMKKDELCAICKERKIKGISRKTKKELIQVLVHSDARSVSTPKINAETDINVEPVIKKAMSSISREDAEKSATEWLGDSPSIMRDWLVSAIMDEKQHRDIGKVLAYTSEIHVNKWLSEVSGRPISTITGKSWDGITDDDKKKVRNQIKFRMSDWHFETTRRNSVKNAETNGTGHVAYRNDEFDMVAIFKPSLTFGITGSTIRCIPVSALINPSKPDQLITNIPMTIKKIYDNEEKTLEVITSLYQTPL